MVTVELDSDSSKSFVASIRDYQDIDQLSEKIGKELGLSKFDCKMYGFKDKI
jgi:hypothetical protein